LDGVFPFALGADLAPSAAEESRGSSNVAFRSLDMTAPGARCDLAAEFGEAKVLVRAAFSRAGLIGAPRYGQQPAGSVGGSGHRVQAGDLPIGQVLGVVPLGRFYEVTQRARSRPRIL
jgi:hypothetical protein